MLYLFAFGINASTIVASQRNSTVIPKDEPACLLTIRVLDSDLRCDGGSGVALQAARRNEKVDVDASRIRGSSTACCWRYGYLATESGQSFG